MGWSGRAPAPPASHAVIEAAKKRLHQNVLAIALANKLARIAWAVLAKGRDFEATRTLDGSTKPDDQGAVLGTIKAKLCERP